MPDGIEFNEGDSFGNDDLLVQRPIAAVDREPFSITNILKRTKLVETDAQARTILIVISVILFFIAIYIMAYTVFGIGKNNKPQYIITAKARAALPTAPKSTPNPNSPQPN
jgi:hypothetical protein